MLSDMAVYPVRGLATLKLFANKMSKEKALLRPNDISIFCHFSNLLLLNMETEGLWNTGI